MPNSYLTSLIPSRWRMTKGLGQLLGWPSLVLVRYSPCLFNSHNIVYIFKLLCIILDRMIGIWWISNIQESFLVQCRRGRPPGAATAGTMKIVHSVEQGPNKRLSLLLCLCAENYYSNVFSVVSFSMSGSMLQFWRYVELHTIRCWRFGEVQNETS